jgi:hypothetical protein
LVKDGVKLTRQIIQDRKSSREQSVLDCFLASRPNNRD